MEDICNISSEKQFTGWNSDQRLYYKKEKSMNLNKCHQKLNQSTERKKIRAQKEKKIPKRQCDSVMRPIHKWPLIIDKSAKINQQRSKVFQLMMLELGIYRK